jgi:isopenicillin-N epimerase
MNHPKDFKPLFQLNPEVTFLNFGSFGACPKPIFDKYQSFQREMEYEPVQFILNKGVKYLEQSRIELGKYLGCNSKDVVFIPNPTYSVNLVVRALDLQPGDEILTTDIEYGGCEKTLEFICKKTGAKLVKVPTILPISSREEFVNQFISYFSNKTKLVFISHITSTTAIRLPVEEIVIKAKEVGIFTFVDGAHACGQIPLNIEELDVDFYTGACHKWMMTPKGSSFFYARKSVQSWLDPLIVSWGYNALFPSDSQFLDYHQFNGTKDYTPYLCIPESIRFMEEYKWWDVSADCRQLIKDNMHDYFQLLGATPHAPLDDFWILQMLAAEIVTDQPEKLYRKIYDEYKIEMPVMRHGDKVFLRFSINVFNDQADIDKLFDMIKKEGIRGK